MIVTPMKINRLYDKLEFWAAATVVFILAMVPFHALLTTWTGSNFGHLDLIRIWKELLCLPLGIFCVWVLARKKMVRAQLFSAPIFWLCLAYCLFSVVMGAWAFYNKSVNSTALIFSLIINLRLVIFMVFVWIMTLNIPWLARQWRLLLLVPALLVISFGILQRLVLPIDFLRHVGYGTSTIPAVQTVDQQIDFRRVQSTLRGANPLGAYMLVVVTALCAMWAERRDARKFGAFLVAAAVSVLLLTYSRSAYLGAALSVAFLAWQLQPSAVTRKRIAMLGCMGLLIVLIGIFTLRHNDTVQNTVFHSSEKSPSSISSNAGRSAAIKDGLRDIKHQPFGRGPGTAGPASFRNAGHTSRIAENYYIQLAQEVGVAGLALFVAINVLLGLKLWRQRLDMLPLVLLASLLGLTLVNMLSHAWADDTLAYIWWGLAGLALGAPTKTKSDIIRTNTENHAKTKPKTIKKTRTR
jgi:hypothetical protein